MTLIADKETSKRIEDRLSEYSKFGMTLYYLYEKGRVKEVELEDMFLSSDDEKSCFEYGKIIRGVQSQDLTESYKKYSEDNPNTNNEAEKDYQDKLNLLYTKKIINNLLANKSNKHKIYVNTYNHLLKEIDFK